MHHSPHPWRVKERMLLVTQTQATYAQGTHSFQLDLHLLKKVRSNVMRCLWSSDFYTMNPNVTFALLVPPHLAIHYNPLTYTVFLTIHYNIRSLNHWAASTVFSLPFRAAKWRDHKGQAILEAKSSGPETEMNICPIWNLGMYHSPECERNAVKSSFSATACGTLMHGLSNLFGFYPFLSTQVLQSNDRVPNQIRSIVAIESGMAFPLEPLLSVHSS